MQLLTFVLGTVEFGISIQHVRSIEQNTRIINIPDTLPCIKGIMNLHGEIIPIYSMTKRFNYPEPAEKTIVVVETADLKVGLEIGGMPELVSVEEGQVMPMPGMVNHTQNFATNVANQDKKLIVMLEISQLISDEEQSSMKDILEKQKKKDTI